jgi:YidC/Oxa1 family membrane protein insertase
MLMFRVCSYRVRGVRLHLAYSRRNLGLIATVASEIGNFISSLQSTTGLPFYASIAATTILVRTTMLPISRYQVVSTEKLAVTLRDINALVDLFSKHVKKRKETEQISYTSLLKDESLNLVHGVNAIIDIRETPIKGVLVPLFVNIGVFATFIFSVRVMISDPNYSQVLINGGTSFFSNLTVPDRTNYLPLAAALVNYASIDKLFPSSKTHLNSNSEPSEGQGLKDFFQSIIVLSLPIMVTFPSGVFMYWIPSALFTLGQRFFFANEKVRSVLKMPPVSSLNKTPYSSDRSEFPEIGVINQFISNSEVSAVSNMKPDQNQKSKIQKEWKTKESKRGAK